MVFGIRVQVFPLPGSAAGCSHRPRGCARAGAPIADSSPPARDSFRRAVSNPIRCDGNRV